MISLHVVSALFRPPHPACTLLGYLINIRVISCRCFSLRTCTAHAHHAPHGTYTLRVGLQEAMQHYALSTTLDHPVVFADSPLVVQYDVTYTEGTHALLLLLLLLPHALHFLPLARLSQASSFSPLYSFLFLFFLQKTTKQTTHSPFLSRAVTPLKLRRR